jgi:hypothetical protein
VVALAALAAAILVTTQGCDAEPAAQASISTSGHPDVTFAQAQTVFQSYVTASDTAAEQGDATTGLALTSDASWAFAHAQYTAQAADNTPVERYAYGTPTYYVPIVSAYPHWFVVDVPRRPTGSGQRSSVRTLMVFAQFLPGGAWTVAGETALQPGQAMPSIATDAQGYAVEVSPSQSGLVLEPNFLGGTQAAVVDEGPEAAAASLVTPGPQTTGLYEQQKAILAGTPKNLEYIWYMAGATFPVFAMRMTNGDALVLYGIYLDTSVLYPNNGTGTPLPVPADVSAQFSTPGEIADHGLDVNWTYQFAAIDPSASVSNGAVTVIAATSAITYTKAY